MTQKNNISTGLLTNVSDNTKSGVLVCVFSESDDPQSSSQWKVVKISLNMYLNLKF